MIVWSGFGYIVAIIAFFCLISTQSVANALFGDNYYGNHGWPKTFALWVAAGLVFLLAQLLNRRKGRVVIDKVTGQEMILSANHALFFINVRYWPFILLAGGVVAVFF